jgi:hypothetical protein
MRKAKVPGIEFGEAALWKRKATAGHLAKLASMCDDGVCLGVKGTTGEIIVGNMEGV